jgi:hypothetical protein
MTRYFKLFSFSFRPAVLAKFWRNKSFCLFVSVIFRQNIALSFGHFVSAKPLFGETFRSGGNPSATIGGGGGGLGYEVLPGSCTGTSTAWTA